METEKGIEWPTMGLLLLCYFLWGMATWVGAAAGAVIAVPVLAVVIALHSSLQHEVLHGHPTASRHINEALVFPALGLAIPYRRFRDTHLAHHRNELLTDPYDDPESNYLDPKRWQTLPLWLRWLLRFNNTLVGRMSVGPAIGLAAFYRSEIVTLYQGEARVARAWVLHIGGMAVVFAWLGAIGMSIGPYLLACYGALSILKIRTFLEHRADADPAGRSVIVEDCGPLALLFLNNNLHAVHHAHPSVAWYRLPALYWARREAFLRRNGGYRYGSYADVFRRHLLRGKDPVAHPLLDE